MKKGDVQFRAYKTSDLEACLDLFDENCPKYFAENERDAYRAFLGEHHLGYQLGFSGDRLVAAFGLDPGSEDRSQKLTWIMVSPTTHGSGLGSSIMEGVMALMKTLESPCLEIAASHVSAPFFAKFGAKEVKITDHGWGEGMHRVDMALRF